MDWFIERLDHTDPAFDYRDLLNHEDDFKGLLNLKIIKHTGTLDSIPCDLCDADHLITPFPNAKGEIVISCSGSRRTVSPDELRIWTVNRDSLIKSVQSRNSIIDKALLDQTMFASINRHPNKYSYANEPIKLKVIGIEIRGRNIFRGSTKTSVGLTDTDRRLVYFLYFKYKHNGDECSTLDQLALEPFDDSERKDNGYIKNRIVVINKAVKKPLAIMGRTSIGHLIKHERGRGYHLNPKLMEVGQNSKENHKMQRVTVSPQHQ